MSTQPLPVAVPPLAEQCPPLDLSFWTSAPLAAKRPKKNDSLFAAFEKSPTWKMTGRSWPIRLRRIGKELLFDPPQAESSIPSMNAQGIFRRFFVSRKFFMPLFFEKSGKDKPESTIIRVALYDCRLSIQFMFWIICQWIGVWKLMITHSKQHRIPFFIKSKTNSWALPGTHYWLSHPSDCQVIWRQCLCRAAWSRFSPATRPERSVNQAGIPSGTPDSTASDWN